MTPLSHSFKVRHLILAAALTTGLGFVNPANAQTQKTFFVDLASRTAIDLGASRGGWSYSYAEGINNAGQGWEPISQLMVIPMPSSLVLTGWG